MEVEYLDHVLTFRPPDIEIRRRDGRLRRSFCTTEMPTRLRHLLRQPHTRYAVILGLMEEVLSRDEDASLHVVRDTTYVGARDRLLKIAIHWNRRKLRPLFVPDVQPVPLKEAFGGQGAMTKFWGTEIIVYFERRSQFCHLRLRRPGEADVDIPITSVVDYAITWLALYLRDRTDITTSCCTETVGHDSSAGGSVSVDARQDPGDEERAAA